MYDLIVIGAGPGGYEAAAHAAKLGKKTALVEKHQPGGICLHAGCIPTKTYLHSARVLQDCREAADYGITLGEIGFDFARMRKRRDEVVARLTRGVTAMLKKSGVELINGTARLAAPHTVAVGDDLLETRNILLATGSRPVVPPIPGITSPAVLDSTGLLNLKQVPASLAVIGASAVGLEFACFFRTLGCAVTVVEMLPRIAFQMDEELTGYLQQDLSRQGINFLLSARVTAIDGHRVTYTDAQQQTCQLEAEWILNATGRIPNLEGLGLEELEVAAGRQGIRTDDQGRTNVPGIWACGDVTGRLLLAHAATREGLVAVNNMFGSRDTMRYHAIPSVVYTHPEIAGAGMTEQQLQQQGTPYSKVTLPLTVSGRFLAENEHGQGYVKVLAGSRYREILGIHLLGGAAGEMIFGPALMLEMEMRVPDLSGVVFPHPTVSEAIKEAICQIKAKGDQ